MSRIRVILACAGWVALTGACGLFRSEPDLPAAVEVTAARAQQAGQWARLERCIRWVQEDPIGGWARMTDLRARFPEDARLAALVQDLEIQRDGRSATREIAIRRWQERPTAIHAYLAARVEPNKEIQRDLLVQALVLDPGLEQVEVLQIALEARAGEPKALERLIRLLRRHPGLGEGWRLLAELGPLYARPDLALRAEQTEPWSSFDDPRRATLALASAELAGGAPERALEILASLGATDTDATVLRAAAHASAGRPVVARRLLEELIGRDPQHAVAHFNLGLLFRDYLDDPVHAEQSLQLFLETSDLPEEQNLFRRIQAEFWLSELRKARVAAAVPVGE
jgi:hypothetical protein